MSSKTRAKRSGRRGGAILLVVALALTVLAVGCGGGGTESSEAPAMSTDVLRFASASSITTWDPRVSYSTEVGYMGNMYETLLRSNPPGSEEPFTPVLATDWSVSKDGMAWTFHLREGVTFHDGAPFNAEAVTYSIDGTTTLGLGAGYLWWPLDKIEVVDDYTCVFKLNYPAPIDRILSSSYAAWIYSPKTKGKSPKWWDKTNYDGGTGAYQLVSYKANEELEFKQFADYWGGWEDNNFKNVVVKIVADATTSRQMLESGAVDIQTTVSYDDVPGLKQNPDLNLIQTPGIYNYLLCFNTQKKPLDNVKARQALSYAIPYEEVLTVGANDLGRVAYGPIPSTLWPGSTELPQYHYDLDKAKELLAEAGYPDGFKIELTYASENPTSTAFVPLLKESWAEIGVDVDIQGLLWNQQWEKIKGKEADRQDVVATMWWPAFNDGYDTLKTLFGTEEEAGWNFSYWYNEHFDQLIGDAFKNEAVDIEKAKQQYMEAQTMLIDEAVGAFLFDADTVYAQSAKLKVVERNPFFYSTLEWHKLTPK